MESIPGRLSSRRKLVVEIDGETWHGSPDAKERDAARDEIIRAEGYTVLRIPAKVVLTRLPRQ